MRLRVRSVLLLGILAAALVIFAAHSAILSALGSVLVENDAASGTVDAIVVLAGDWHGERILKACQLASEGTAPVVLVSGPIFLYGQNEADLAIGYAAARGCPTALLQACRLPANSTEEEAHAFASELRRRGIRTVAIVTSNFHTARSGRIFRRILGRDTSVRIVSAPNRYFEPQTWWKTREGRKIWLLEMTKTLTGMVGI